MILSTHLNDSVHPVVRLCLPICRHMLGPTHYAIGLAVLPEQRDVIIVGQPLTKGSPACIAAIGLDEPHPLKGPWSRPRTTTASCIAVLPGGRQFAVGRYLFCSKPACTCTRLHHLSSKWHHETVTAVAVGEFLADKHLLLFPY